VRTIAFALLGSLLGFGTCLAENWQVQLEHYRKLTCLQIMEEGHTLSKRGFALTGSRGGGGSEGSRSTSATVIVWSRPTHIDSQQQAELAQADSQMNALEHASIESQCSIQFQRPNG